MTLDIDFLPGEQYTLGDSRLIYLRRVKARVPMWLFQYPSGPLETFTEWQLEDALSPDGRRSSRGPDPTKARKPPKDTPFKRTFGKGQKIRPPKKGDGLKL